MSDFINTPPEWGNEGTEPTAQMKKSGFTAGYKPPAAYFNWFWHKVGACISELQTVIANKTHTGILYRNETPTEPNTIYFVIDEDKPGPEEPGTTSAITGTAICGSAVCGTEG